MIRQFFPFACISLLSLSATVMAAGDAAEGEKKSQVCVACHAAEGKSQIPLYPILAGQYADYITVALKAYQSGARNNEIMKGFAATLTPQDIADLAAYFSSRQGGVYTLKMD